VAQPPTVAQQGRILILCTANQARSPVLAALLQEEASRRELGRDVRICDAGIEAVAGAPLLPTMRAVLVRHGMSLDHHSRPLDRNDLDSELVLTMTAVQRRWVLQRDGHLLPRVFTVRELCRLVSSQDWPAARPALEDVGPAAHLLRPRVAPGGSDDIEDPAGRHQPAVDGVFDQLRECSAVLGPALFGRVRGGPS
jgi:protein-tyrosine-phosphatase